MILLCRDKEEPREPLDRRVRRETKVLSEIVVLPVEMVSLDFP